MNCPYCNALVAWLMETDYLPENPDTCLCAECGEMSKFDVEDGFLIMVKLSAEEYEQKAIADPDWARRIDVYRTELLKAQNKT